ncbi:TPR repeat-containing protein MJ0941 [Durusdinium trenchii]|uniref:TPR repeat-containing protein MJ0941 n=1 Tax=Durusdinium trenchii TaxID=1381693 RepID=A0ABP0HSB4_9DINO
MADKEVIARIILDLAKGVLKNQPEEYQRDQEAWSDQDAESDGHTDGEDGDNTQDVGGAEGMSAGTMSRRLRKLAREILELVRLETGGASDEDGDAVTALHTFWKLRDKVTKLARPRRRDPGYSDPDDPGGPLEQLSVAQLVRELAKEFLQLSDEATCGEGRYDCEPTYLGDDEGDLTIWREIVEAAKGPAFQLTTGKDAATDVRQILLATRGLERRHEINSRNDQNSLDMATVCGTDSVHLTRPTGLSTEQAASNAGHPQQVSDGGTWEDHEGPKGRSQLEGVLQMIDKGHRVCTRGHPLVECLDHCKQLHRCSSCSSYIGLFGVLRCHQCGYDLCAKCRYGPVALGAKMLRTKEENEAILQHIEKALQMHQESGDIDADITGKLWVTHGEINEALGNHKEAIQNYDKAIELNPEYCVAVFRRGRSKRALGRYEEAIMAIQDYDKAIELDPNDAAMTFFARGPRHALGRYEEAIEDFYKDIDELDPNDAETFFSRNPTLQEAIEDLEKAFELEEAIKDYDYDKAIELDPNDAVAFRNRGYSKQSLHQHQEAIKDYDKAIELDPNDAVAFRNRGYCKQIVGRDEEAIQDYDKAIAMAFRRRAECKQSAEAIEDRTMLRHSSPVVPASISLAGTRRPSRTSSGPMSCVGESVVPRRRTPP